MAEQTEYLVLSRGRWDADKSPAEIQQAIDDFYVWIERHVADGRMRHGSRLAPGTKLVTRTGVIDGPFTEAKEIVGGYWFIVADSLDDAARLAAGNPCLGYGLSLEIRQLDPELASAYNRTCESTVR